MIVANNIDIQNFDANSTKNDIGARYVLDTFDETLTLDQQFLLTHFYKLPLTPDDKQRIRALHVDPKTVVKGMVVNWSSNWKTNTVQQKTDIQ